MTRTGESGRAITDEQCDHGVTFDEAEVQRRQRLNPPSASEVRRRWPRLFGPCPKGCGYNGIAYASFLHYVMGDW
jgi:hypothetical protein